MAAAGGVVVPVAAAARAPIAMPTRTSVAKAMLVLGCAAAAVALFAMTLSPADSAFLGPCKRTDEEAADLRRAAAEMLLLAGAQVLVSTAAVLLPALPFVLAAIFVGLTTACKASFFLLMLVSCHGHLHGFLAVAYWFLVLMMGVSFIVATVVTLNADD